MYYILITLAALLFSLQFLCQQKYEKIRGTDASAALTFSFYKGIACCVLMLILSRFRLQFSIFSFLISGVYALAYILMIYFSLKAFSVANLSVYSVFTMLGGMILPFFTGILFYNEELTVFKILCCILITASILLNIKKGKGSKQAIIYYMLVFTLNGTISSITKVHQNSNLNPVDSTSFMFYSGLFTILICGVWIYSIDRKLPVVKGNELLYSSGDGLLNGFGDLLLLISLLHLPASVQYPIVTGGVMFFSTFISVLRREKVSKREYLAAIIALISSVMVIY